MAPVACHKAIAIRGESVHKTVGGAIIGLPFHAKSSSDGGKKDKKIEFKIAACLIEVDQTGNFWPENP